MIFSKLYHILYKSAKILHIFCIFVHYSIRLLNTKIVYYFNNTPTYQVYAAYIYLEYYLYDMIYYKVFRYSGIIIWYCYYMDNMFM